jgi:hypothetical protein
MGKHTRLAQRFADRRAERSERLGPGPCGLAHVGWPMWAALRESGCDQLDTG